MTTHFEPLGQAEWTGGGTTKPLGDMELCGPHTRCRGHNLHPALPGDITKTDYLGPFPAGLDWFQVQIISIHGSCGVYYNGCRIVHDIPGQGDVGFCSNPVYPAPPEVQFFINDMSCIVVDTSSWPVLQPDPGLYPDYVGYTGDPSTAGGEGPPESYFVYDPIGTHGTGLLTRPNFSLVATASGEAAGGFVWGFFAEILCYDEVDDSDTTPPVGTVNFGLIRRGTFYGYEPTRR